MTMAGRILVVDDDPLILMTIEKALSRVGYAVVTARNTLEVDAALTRKPFDLLILDLYLKDDSAEDILNKILGVIPSLKILRMSGTINNEGAPDFIEKPFKIDDLRKRVRDIINDKA